MNTFLKFLVAAIFLYTIGYSITLWKEKNKVGAAGVMLLAMTIAVLPFLTIFK